VSIELYQRYPRAPEGDLTRLRAALIRESSLAELARGIELSDFLRMGGGELKSGGYRRDSILADTFEALVAAVFLDAGWDACQALIRQLFSAAIEAVDLTAAKDFKTRLQEWLQGRGMPLPDYQLVATEGKDHDKTFRVECRIIDLDFAADAVGRSRKSAEQAAAAAVLEHIERSHGK
jgi:ribonuclease III